MGSIVAIVFIWALFMSGVGFVLSRMEAKINNAPPKTLSAILWCVLVPACLGIVVVGARMHLTRAANSRKAEQVRTEAAQVVLDERRPGA
jgi:hypothetical protein